MSNQQWNNGQGANEWPQQQPQGSANEWGAPQQPAQEWNQQQDWQGQAQPQGSAQDWTQSAQQGQDWNQQQGQWNQGAQDWNQQGAADQGAQDWNQGAASQGSAQDWTAQQAQAAGTDWGAQSQGSAQDWNQQQAQAAAGTDWGQQQSAQDWNQGAAVQGSAQDWNQQGVVAQGSAQQWQQGQYTPATAKGSPFDFKFNQLSLPGSAGLIFTLGVVALGVEWLFGFISLLTSGGSSYSPPAMTIINSLVGGLAEVLFKVLILRVLLEIGVKLTRKDDTAA